MIFSLILVSSFASFAISVPLNLTKILKSQACPYGVESSVAGDSRCYIFHEFPLNYYNSEEFCEGYGAHLATVSNGDINQFISETTEQTFEPEGEFNFWLGAQNLVSPNEWKWVDGSGMTGFTNWNSGEPINASEERCLAAKVGSGKWFADICYTEKPAVCVYQKVMVNPSSVPPSPIATPSPSNACGKGWEYFVNTNSCYFLKETTNFYSDESFCQSQNGHLASVHDFKENEFIIDITKTKDSALLILIGLHQYDSSPESWKWSDSSPLNYSIWDSSSSGLNTTLCTAINADRSNINNFRHWQHVICDDKKIQFSVCKRILT